MQATTIAPFPLRTLTVAGLIAKLRHLPPDAAVVLTSDYGDHVHTEQALAIRSVAEETITTSAYSDSGFKVGEGDEEDDEGRIVNEFSVVALRGVQ